MNERKAGWARTPMIPAVRRDLFWGGAQVGRRVDWTEDCGLYIRGGPHYLTTRENLIRHSSGRLERTGKLSHFFIFHEFGGHAWSDDGPGCVGVFWLYKWVERRQRQG
jgi:hypothetical protein